MSNSSRDEFYVSGADTFHNSHLRIARPRSAVPSETSVLGPARMQGRTYIERALAFSAIARASQSSLVDFHTVSGHNRFEFARYNWVPVARGGVWPFSFLRRAWLYSRRANLRLRSRLNRALSPLRADIVPQG